MKKLLPLLLTSSIGLSTFAVPVFEDHTTVSAKDTKQSNTSYYKVFTKKEPITLNDGSKTTVNMLQPSNLTANKKLQKQIKKDILKMVAFTSQQEFSAYKKREGNSSKIHIDYEIVSNKNMRLSIRAEMYFENEDPINTSYKGAFNFNYIKNKAGVDKSWILEKQVKDKKAFNKYVKTQSKKIFGVSVSYPDHSVSPYLIKENGDVLIVFNGDEIGRRYWDYYYLSVPKKFFK